MAAFPLGPNPLVLYKTLFFSLAVCDSFPTIPGKLTVHSLIEAGHCSLILEHNQELIGQRLQRVAKRRIGLF